MYCYCSTFNSKPLPDVAAHLCTELQQRDDGIDACVIVVPFLLQYVVLSIFQRDVLGNQAEDLTVV